VADRRRGRRGLFWSAIVAALAALVGGSIFAYVTYAATAGPDGAVKGYFAALARGDAPAALGFGDLPPGPHELLSSTVLRAQRKIAPIRNVEIIATDQSGDRAKVTVQYDLAFAAATQQVADDVQVVRHKGSWRLARTAATTQLHLLQAGERAMIMGGAVPDGTTLIFPGAVPITFDTPYLRLAATTSSVPLSAPADTDLIVQVTPAGRIAADAAVATALRACLSGGAKADPRCPLPTSRAVPGSLRATVSAADVRSAAAVGLAATAHGVITVSGKIKLTGRYTALDFDNQPVAKKGAVSLPLLATAYATSPITINWGGGADQ
jgi:hypothetical protein